MANNIEIIKPMQIETSDGKTYTLEFNRNSVISAEKAGFRPDLVAEMPNTMIPLMFYAAFKMHHPNIKREETDRILTEELCGLQPAEVERLSEMYLAPTKALIRSKEDGERKNCKVSL